MGAVAGGGRKPRVQYSESLGQEIVRRVAAGETVEAICGDAGMPTRTTVTGWARTYREKFGRPLNRARTLAGWDHEKHRRASRFCEVTAQEIFARLCEGESLTSICADPAMPGASTVARWRARWPHFADAMRVAREVQGERFCDLGWEIACEATRETATATRVKLEQLRWQAGKLAPRRYGPIRPVESEFAAESPVVEEIVTRKHFRIETRPDGWVRVVGFAADPDTGQVVRVTPQDAPWSPPPPGTWLRPGQGT